MSLHDRCEIGLSISVHIYVCMTGVRLVFLFLCTVMSLHVSVRLVFLFLCTFRSLHDTCEIGLSISVHNYVSA